MDRFSIDIKSGELMVLLEPSGCGKDYRNKVHSRIDTSHNGQIHLGNKKINKLYPKDRDVAMVFQNYALYPHMSIRDNFAFLLKMRKKSKSHTTIGIFLGRNHKDILMTQSVPFRM